MSERSRKFLRNWNAKTVKLREKDGANPAADSFDTKHRGIKQGNTSIIKPDKNVLTVLGIWLSYLVGILPIINCIVVVWWLFNSRDRDKSLKEHRRLTYVIYVSAFFTIWGILHVGIETFLFIIPYSWGSYDEEGKWIIYRKSIAGTLAFFGSFLIAHIFTEYQELTRKTECLEEKNYQIEKKCGELTSELQALTEDELDEEEIGEDKEG